MGDKLSNPYMFANRYDQETGKRTNMVGAHCKKCGKEEWYVAPAPGWGRRIFKTKGWSLGNGPNSHVCKACEEFRRSGIRHRVEPAAPGRVIHFGSPELDPALLAENVEPPPPTPEPEPVNTQLAEALAPVKAALEVAAEVEPEPEPEPAPTPERAPGLSDLYPNEARAKGGARHFLADKFGLRPAQIGVDFIVLEEASGARFRLLGQYASAIIPRKRQYSTAGRQSFMRKPNEKPHPGRWLVRQSAVKMVASLGFEDTTEGLHFRLRKLKAGWVYSLIGEALYLWDPSKRPQPDPVVSEVAAPAAPVAAETGPALIEWGGFLSRFDARKAALKQIGATKKYGGAPQENVDYWIYQDGTNLWGYRNQPIPTEVFPVLPAPGTITRAAEPPTWSHAMVDAAALRRQRGGVSGTASRPNAAVSGSKFNVRRAAENAFRRIGIENAQEGIHYTVKKLDDRLFSYSVIEPVTHIPTVTKYEGAWGQKAQQPYKEPEVTDASSQAVRDQMEAQRGVMVSQPTVTEVRQPTLEDRKRVRNAIEEHYDEDHGHYRGDWTDKALAEHLKVPRIWVSTIRENYGPDINKNAEIKAQAQRLLTARHLEEADSLARQAAAIAGTVIELSAKLENVMGELALKRKELGL